MQNWVLAKLAKARQVAKNVKELSLRPEKKIDFKSGQYFELRLGESARPYSAVCASGSEVLEFAVQLLAGGELSPKLWSLKEGDELLLRGPFQEEISWQEKDGGPLLLIGGGAGVAPLLSIARTRQKAKEKPQTIFLASFKDSAHALYAEEIGKMEGGGFKPIVNFTEGSAKKRVNAEKLKKIYAQFPKPPRAYVCGSTPFVESVTQNLMLLGVDMEMVFSERFGGREYE